MGMRGVRWLGEGWLLYRRHGQQHTVNGAHLPPLVSDGIMQSIATAQTPLHCPHMNPKPQAQAPPGQASPRRMGLPPPLGPQGRPPRPPLALLRGVTCSLYGVTRTSAWRSGERRVRATCSSR